MNGYSLSKLVTTLLRRGDKKLAKEVLATVLPDSVIDILHDHVEQRGSLDKSIQDFEKYGDQELHLPRSPEVKASVLAAELRSWKPRPHGGDVTVYHATDPKTARFILENGVIPQMKSWTLASSQFSRGGPAEFAPGKGLERGIYVGSSPEAVSGFGRTLLKLRVPRDWLLIPAEMKNLGYDDVDQALKTEHGAIIKHAIHPHNIKKV